MGACNQYSPFNNSSEGKSQQHKKLASICKVSIGIIDELYNPIDAINRFINLALRSIEENSQGRQFLLESKQGIRRVSVLLKKLNNHMRKIERGIRDISAEGGEEKAGFNSKRR